MKRSLMHRVLAFAMVLAMVFTMIPAPAFAAETVEEITPVTEAVEVLETAAAESAPSESAEPETPTTEAAAPVIVDITTALAGETGAEFTVKGVITLIDGKNLYLQDATGGICLRLSANPEGVALGDTVIGTGTLSVYNGLPQLSGTFEKSEGLTLTAKQTTIDALTTADICTYVKITGLEITEIYDNNGAYTTPNITVKDAAGNTIQLYKAIVDKTALAVGDIIDVQAAVGVYKTTLQLRNTLASEVTKVQQPTEPEPSEPAPTDPSEPEGPVIVDIATALAGETGAEFTVKGVITLIDGKNLYLQDATGGICLRLSANPEGVALGDTVIGTGTLSVYNGLPQLSGTFEKSEGLTLTAKQTTIDALTTADICTYVKITGLEITEIYDNNGAYTTPNITVKDAAGNTIQLYKAIVDKTALAVGDIIDVQAAVGVYKTTLQLRNTLASEVTKVQQPQDPLANGNTVVIYAPGYMKALSATKTGNYNVGVDVAINGETMTGYGETEIWTVIVNDDGTYSFANGGQNIGMAESYSSMNLGAVYDKWELVELSDGLYNVKNVGRGNFLEWYDKYSNWSTYNSSSAATDPQFQISFFSVKEDVPSEPEQPTEPSEPEEPEQPAGSGTYLVTDAAELAAGDQIVIVAADSDVALGTTQNNNNRAQAAVTKDGNAVTYGEDVQIITLEEGTVAGTFAMNVGDGYLYAASSDKNYLRTETAKSDNGAWTITIDENGIATIKANGEFTRNWLRYNSQSSLFACYKSGQQDVKIYKIVTVPENPLSEGSRIVIYNPANMMALSTAYAGYYNAGTPVTMADGVLSGYTAADVWTVGVNDDGTFTFSTADGKKLSMGASFSSMPLDDVNTAWEVTDAATEGCVYIKNVARGNYIEWYADKNNWSSYYNIGSNEALFAQAIYKVPAELPEEGGMIQEGDKVVIFNVSAQGVLSLQDDNETSPSITNVAATVESGKATVANGGLIFTVSKNGEYYRFHNEAFGYLSSNGTGSNAFYQAEANDDADWLLAEYNGGYSLESRTAKFNGKYSQFLEYYAGAYKTYSMYNVTDEDIYTFHFYPCANEDAVVGGVVNAPAVIFGTLPDAYVGMEYSFRFSVDAPFGVAEVAVTVNETAVEATADSEGYAVTVPVECITGEKLTVTVTGTDNKGVAFTGTVDVAVVDEPVISDVTPAAGAQTGDDKKPTISARIINGGEAPTVTMTLAGEEVAAVFEEGVVSYTPENALADGRTSVTVTVTRADGKTATKTWSFTVGKAQYQLFFGQLHSHTTYSDGSGSLETALDYIKNLPESANVDFVAFTDHSNYFDKSGAANPEGALYDMSLATAYSQETWASYKDTIAAFNEANPEVIAIGGFEMTWSGGPGHINTFNTPGIVSRNNSTLNNKTADAGMKAYYALLSQMEGKGSISQFNHPGSTFGTFTDFAYWDAVVDDRIFLVEVGNGEGQIGAGGYYPSYEYYTMALDKGWHVAPTNNQDNHKGKWGNANEARDVVLTDDFTEQGLYEAMRQYRVYASEDKNLEIYYTVNGQLLGSVIEEVPEKLNISVSVADPDATDSISKVEIVANSGKVVYTWNDPEALASGVLNCTLDSGYSYYYVRVTEGDGDLAVTAPVWVGDTLKLGISAVECGTSTPVTGEELTITTTLFNSESTAAKVKSLVYTVGGEVLGTDNTGYTIPASGTVSAKFAYTPSVARIMKITVTAIVELNGQEYTFTMDIELDVQDADRLVYIGIDASHYNEYVAGNYKDSMGNFGALAAGYSVRTVDLKTSADLVAACSNGKYKALILTAPSRRLPAAQEALLGYTAEELAAIKAFNDNGGVVILAGWSDHYEYYPDVASIAGMKPEQHMAATQNQVLETLGSCLRIGDDATYDDSYNGGQAYRLYFNSYNFDSFLVNGVEVDPENPHDRLYTEVFSYYGGATVYTVDGTLPETVTPVVYGHSTTYSVDVDKDGLGANTIPKYPYAEGDDRLMAVATEALPGQGLIVVSGAAFMSNFEVQATIEDSGAEKNYANYRICENLVGYLNPAVITPISEVRAQSEAGYKYTIEGVVTSNASGYDKDTAFFDCIYVQDATGGICCFPVAGNYKIGDKVRITGTTEFYQGEPELQVTSIEIVGEGTVEPTVVTAAEINDRSAEGKLVTLTGTVESYELANGMVQTIMVRDAHGNVARVFIDGYITTAEDVRGLEPAAAITVTGLASYDDTFNAPEGPFPRIRVRNREDVICGYNPADYNVFARKSLTLKVINPETNKAYTSKQITWAMDEKYEPFATLSKTGKLTAKKVVERSRIEVVGTVKATQEKITYLVDVFPAVTQLEVKQDDRIVNGKTVAMDFTEKAITLTATAYPLDLNVLENVTWKISDSKKEAYAEYDASGDTLVISNPKGKAGTVTVTATVNAGVKKTVTVKVTFGSFAKTVKIDTPEKTELKGGETLALTAAITEPETVTKPGIVWSVSNKAAATVSAAGKVTAKNVAHPTDVVVTATSKDGQASDSIVLRILPKTDAALVLMNGNSYVTNGTKALNVGDTYQLNALLVSNGETDAATVTWTSSKEAVATVENGLITAVAAGTAKITAADDAGRKAVFTVTVSTLVGGMEVTTKDGKNIIEEQDEKLAIVSSGKSVSLVANVLPEGAKKSVSWQILEGAEFAKITSAGKLTANKNLTGVSYVLVQATAKDGSGISATMKVKIVPLAAGVQIYQNGTRVRSNTVYVHDMQANPVVKLTAKVYPVKAQQNVQWTSSNKKVAAFVDGELVCYKAGTVTITAKALDGSNAKTTFKLKVVKLMTDLTLKEDATLTVVGGKSLKLASMVEISPVDTTNKKLTWSVAPNDYGIKISATGVLTTKKVTESVTVNVMALAKDGSGKMISFDVTVNPA